MTVYFHDNKFYTDSENTINHLHRAVKYADGLFETILVKENKAPLLKLHIERLLIGLAFFQFPISDAELTLQHKQKIKIDADNLIAIIIDLLQKNNLKTARVRLQINRIGDGFYLPENNIAEIIITSSPIEIDFQKEVTVGFSAYKIAATEWSQFKTTNAAPYILSAIENKKNNLQQGILLNTNLQVADATSSNVFFVKNGNIYTPPLATGAIAGTVRTWLISNFSVIEKEFGKEELMQADEIFLTNAVHGIMSATLFSNKKNQQKITKDIQQSFSKYWE